MRLRRFAALSLSLALLAGGGDSSERKKLAATFKGGFEGSSDIPISDEEADCAAGGIIDALGKKRIAELDKTDKLSMTPAEAKKVIPVIKKCLDISALFTQGILQGDEGSLSEKSAKCLSDALSNSTFIDSALEAAFTGGEAPDVANDPAFSITMVNAMRTCLSPEEIAKATGG